MRAVPKEDGLMSKHEMQRKIVACGIYCSLGG